MKSGYLHFEKSISKIIRLVKMIIIKRSSFLSTMSSTSFIPDKERTLTLNDLYLQETLQSKTNASIIGQINLSHQVTNESFTLLQRFSLKWGIYESLFWGLLTLTLSLSDSSHYSQSHDSPQQRDMHFAQPILNGFAGKWVILKLLKQGCIHDLSNDLMTLDSDYLLKNLHDKLRVKSHKS